MRAACRRRRARRSRTGRIASRRCSARREFGDDVDRPLKKSDGSYTYFASDIAYHRTKLERGFRTLIDVWGADHGGYIKRMQAAVAALSDRKAELDVKVVQLVKLLRAGEPVKMSKRAGEFVTLREVVDEVGRDAVRFMMLFRKNDAVLEFDLAKVMEQSRDNPVFYVQYGHARAQSMFRNARAAFPELPADLAELWSTSPRSGAALGSGRTRLDAAYCPLSANRRGRLAGPRTAPNCLLSVRLSVRISCALHARQRIATFTLHYPE